MTSSANAMPETDYVDVTETAGDEVSQEQVDRAVRRYSWAMSYCAGRDVLEVACGTGPGLGLLLKVARRVFAGDISPAMVERVHRHYGNRVDVRKMDAQSLPFDDASLDVVIIFEALYYVKEPRRFVQECARVLRPGGHVLISTANKDLFDFNPSPYSHEYHGVADFGRLFDQGMFELSFWGDTPVERLSLRQRVLRPVKKAVVLLGIMPKTMAGKRILKRLVFGQLVLFPAEIATPASIQTLVKLPAGIPDRRHKVILCAAKKL